MTNITEPLLRSMVGSINEGLPQRNHIMLTWMFGKPTLYDVPTKLPITKQLSPEAMYAYLLGFAAGMGRCK